MNKHGMNMELVKIQNRSVILHCINDAGSISRKDIAERTGLTAAAVTLICNEFIRDKLIIEGESVKKEIGSGAGRRKVLISIDYKSNYFVAISIETDRTVIAITDMQGNPSKIEKIKTNKDCSPEEFLNQISECTKKLISECPNEVREKISIGAVSIPGIVDSENGKSIQAYGIWNDEVDVCDILKEKTGIENVYFSPAGSLNKLSIENMKADNVSLMSEKYRLYRLSNTRDLIQQKNTVPSNTVKRKAVLFGGINYNFTQEDWTAVSAQNIHTQLLALRSGEKDGRGAHNASLPYLKGTKTEVDAISKVLQTNRIRYSTFSGNNATEDVFKGLSNQGVTSLHIATHGFYSTDSVTKNNNYDRDFEIKEDKSMMQNGLFFAGANAYFYEEDIPDNVNDGVLSAQEVSYLDFTDCSLVSLSACETGLGEVSGEGVFGLQRGFKKAGVNSILMSLWKVDDEATCKLMTEFYSNWIAKKMTKHDALEAAKKVVRETKGWEDPKYWAAFILLDGLD